MSPPPYSDGKFAYKLYLLGGVLINLAGVILAFLVLLLKNDAGLIANSFILSGICIILANIRINGLGDVDTDLTVLVSAQNYLISRRAFWIQLYLVFPYSSRKMEFADNFKRFIQYMNIEVVDIDSKIADIYF